MTPLEIILIIAVVLEAFLVFYFHFSKQKTISVYYFLNDMVTEQGKSVFGSLKDLKEKGTYAEPTELTAALGEALRFTESFNSAVIKHFERLKEQEDKVWFKMIFRKFKRPRPAYPLPAKTIQEKTLGKEFSAPPGTERKGESKEPKAESKKTPVKPAPAPSKGKIPVLKKKGAAPSAPQPPEEIHEVVKFGDEEVDPGKKTDKFPLPKKTNPALDDTDKIDIEKEGEGKQEKAESEEPDLAPPGE